MHKEVKKVLLLLDYLNMVKKSRSKMLIRKEPEIITLESSDDEEINEGCKIVVDCIGEVDHFEITDSPSVKEFHAESVVDSHIKQNPPPELFTVSVISTNAQAVDRNVTTTVSDIDSDVCIVNSVTKKITSSPKNETCNVLQCTRDTEVKTVSNLDDSVIMVVDSVEQNSSAKLTLSDNDTGNVLKDSNKQAKKRKKVLDKDSVENIEVVEILDDDVIVIDDSLTMSYSNNTHSNSTLSESVICEVESSCVPNTEHQSPQKHPSTFSHSSTSCSSSHPPNPNSTQSLSANQNVNTFSESVCDDSNVVKTQDSGPPKKKSKLAYHRPAHLVTPLTQPTPSVPSTKTDTVTNIYNPNAGSTEKRTGLRPIVIDGNNVATGYGKGTFSLKGIQICVNFFEKRGHRQIKVFIPQYRRNRTNHNELQEMERKGLIVVTPSRKVNGKMVASYDDRYIVQYAAEFGGIIISTDNYRDLLNENPSWKETIENRLLMFTWVDDLLMFPQDPLGRNGPSLDDFLKFPDT